MPQPLDHTHTHGEFRLRYGHPLPFGASHVPGGVNFSIFSANATSCTLVLFEKGAALPFAEIPFPPEYRLGNVWAMTVFDLNYEQIEYGYRSTGLTIRDQGHHFDKEKILLDPDAMEISGRNVWKQTSNDTEIFPFRGRIPFHLFDWGHTRPLKRPESEMVIYELHLRGFTAHESSGVKHPGTFEGSAREDRLPQGSWRQLRRTHAHLRVR